MGTILVLKKPCPICLQKARPVKINNILKVCPKCHSRVN